jgi:hypothetical protein
MAFSSLDVALASSVTILVCLIVYDHLVCTDSILDQKRLKAPLYRHPGNFPQAIHASCGTDILPPFSRRHLHRDVSPLTTSYSGQGAVDDDPGTFIETFFCYSILSFHILSSGVVEIPVVTQSATKHVVIAMHNFAATVDLQCFLISIQWGRLSTSP